MTVAALSTRSVSNSELIKQLNMRKHPEGGYYAETDRQRELVPSPFADKQLRPLASSIFYLLTPEDPCGVFHMNKSATMHVLHHGRAEYTLIYPENPPRIEVHVMGTNVAAGEKLQLLVGSNIWKKSKLLDEDMSRARSDATQLDSTGCLITEVVFPGFHWEDHKYLTAEELEGMWGGKAGWEVWSPFVKAQD